MIIIYFTNWDKAAEEAANRLIEAKPLFNAGTKVELKAY